MSGMRVLVVGSGGREHALGWALSRSASVARVDAAPGNPGLARLGRTWNVRADDLDALVRLALDERFDLVVIGPEDPLALGLADRLRSEDMAVFGPGKAGAQLESSKAFAKEFMERHGIPTAPFSVARTMPEAEAALRFFGAPVVIKASGLAAGKGVVVAETPDEAHDALVACLETRVFGEAGSTVLLERKLEGEEVSVLAVTDGRRVEVLPAAQDHKRAEEGDRGRNTGGMGAYSPAPILTDVLAESVMKRIVEPTLSGLDMEGIEFRGVLFFGLMLTQDGPQLLEYNVRFGDPETEAILPRFPSLDFGALLYEAARGELGSPVAAVPGLGAAVCVVAAAHDYPERGSRGERITGLEAAEATGALVFHAGTALAEGHLVTAGGRILDVVGTGRSIPEAVERVYAALDRVHFPGMRFRKDIARRAFDRARAGHS